MVLRYWGQQGVDADTFAPLLDRSAAGIRTTTLTADLQRRGWNTLAVGGQTSILRLQLNDGRPVIALIEDRPGTFHYVVVVAWHARGVVLHDPARAPFQVMPTREFERRWAAADRWMLVVTRGAAAGDTTTAGVNRTAPLPAAVPALTVSAATSCDVLLARGVEQAQASDLAGAEQTLTQALACPGAAPLRELAGVRLLQRRWPEVAALAGTAVTVDPADTYSWKLLGTSRFLTADASGALAAWNRVGEPTVDLIRVDGLSRTRQRVVERLLDVRAGEMLTPASLLRARRRLADLPAAVASNVQYVPRAAGRAELRAAIVERPAVPSGGVMLVTTALKAAVSREVAVSFGSPTGGGEQVLLGWRFWPRRPAYSAGFTAPAPWGGAWGGVWGVTASTERQPFAAPGYQVSQRTSGRLALGGWPTPRVRLEATAGLDRWRGEQARGVVGGRVRFASDADRVTAALRGESWMGAAPFGTAGAAVRVRTSAQQAGSVLVLRGGLDVVSAHTPLSLWAGGDTGHVRETLVRAHPLLDAGRLRVERLGRALASGSLEGQRWWRAGPVRVAGALFVDGSRTSHRGTGPAVTSGALGEIDVGAGVRVAAPFVPGTLRVDVGHGLRDGATALSLVLAVE